MEPQDNRFAGPGWLERSQQRVEEYVEELIERGELKRKDSRGFIKRIMDQARGEREELRGIVREILTDALSAAGVATRSELDALDERLEQLENKISRLKAAGPAPAKKKTAKKPAVKKPAAKKTAAKGKTSAGKKAK